MGAWKTTEVKLLKEKYTSNGTAIPELLAKHPRKSISHKARELGLKFKPDRDAHYEVRNNE